MPIFTLFTLGESDITVSGGQQLSGFTQGDGSHLVGETITLNSNDWEAVEIDDNDANFNDNENGQELAGAQTIFGTNYADGLRVEAEYTLTVQDPDGNTYTLIGFNVNEPGQSPAYGTVEGLAFIGDVGGFPPRDTPLTVVGASEGPDGSTTPYADYATPPCFTAGTLLDTPDGARSVDALQPGDIVLTGDEGGQPIRWIGRVTLSAERLKAEPRLRPIRIRADAFGAGQPGRDLLVSPQHRILVTGWRAEMHFGTQEALVAARHLVDDARVTVEPPDRPVTYIHILFDRHQIVSAEGLPTESYLPARATLAALDPAAQAEVLALFPDLPDSAPALAPARPILRGWEGGLLGRDDTSALETGKDDRETLG